MIGIAIVLIPIVIKIILMVDLDKIPWFLLHVYRKDGFVFAISPILIIIGIASFLWTILHR
ncbi:hypothetical protein KAS14_01530 [Candidatus Bathyarchaeota archaeon]|nr:hypothetical protein [Candidatus Bathyarchaeota archaeon]